MIKKYASLFIIVLLCLTTQSMLSQDKLGKTSIDNKIEALSVYPNPVPAGRSYLTIISKNNLSKKIEFYNVLGKQIFAEVIVGKELNISHLSKGVYILKITENNISETRKLIVK
ncbi:T9SS type A sorting domain-containing protein [uncultured Algibacter sp.]|uniref:T9SS type A sorting domain-containing protein n=1 Tax=uncultured Algibacter sp. TaxID=298659 RepID=UPI003217B484